MPAKPRKHVYRRDDRVVIVEPLVVRRVGYPLGIVDGVKHVEGFAADINALLVKMGIANDPGYTDIRWDLEVSRDEGVYRALGYAWLKAKRFGGPERTIHTETVEELRGVECWVRGKRTVYTGRRVAGSTSWGYDGIPDSDPPYLSQSKAHVLLELDPVNWDLGRLTDYSSFEIEECHVKPAVTQESGEVYAQYTT